MTRKGFCIRCPDGRYIFWLQSDTFNGAKIQFLKLRGGRWKDAETAGFKIIKFLG